MVTIGRPPSHSPFSAACRTLRYGMWSVPGMNDASRSSASRTSSTSISPAASSRSSSSMLTGSTRSSPPPSCQAASSKIPTACSARAARCASASSVAWMTHGPLRKDERGLRAEARAGDGNVHRAGTVTGCERARRPHVEHDRVAAVVTVLEPRLSAEERAAVDLDDALHVRRARRLRPERGREEVVVALEERMVELPLEADRRRRLRAHRRAAQRPRDVPGIDLDAVAEVDEAPKRRNSPSAPSRDSTARSGRAASPTKSESPVSTSHGSPPRVVSTIAKAQCSGRWPGVCTVRTTTSPTLDLGAVRRAARAGTPRRPPRGRGRAGRARARADRGRRRGRRACASRGRRRA